MSSNDETARFFQRQRALLEKEREVDISRSSLVLSKCSPNLLEQKGLALLSLAVMSVSIGLGGKTLVELERPSAYHQNPAFPPTSFRPGDLARIEPHVFNSAGQGKAKKKAGATEPNTYTSVQGVVYKMSDVRIVISSNSSEELDLPERCKVIKLANTVTYDRMDKAVSDVEKSLGAPNTGPSNLTRVLLGLASSMNATPIGQIVFFDQSLNDSQKECVKFCLESKDVACIHGPPGTGKTKTLIEIILQLVSETQTNPKPLRLLVCGASNLSVDSILERLLALRIDSPKQPKLKLTRIGHPARVMSQEGILESTLEVQTSRSDQAVLAKDVKNELDSILRLLAGKEKGKRPRGAERKKMWAEVKELRKEFRQREGRVVTSVLSDAQIILSTCHSSGGRQLRNIDFDVLIIDEATQAMEAVCWIPILKAKKLILAGDPLQLPPTVLSTTSDVDALRAKAKTSKVKLQRDGGKEEAPDATNSESESENPIPEKAAEEKEFKTLRPSYSLEVTLFERLEKMYGSSIKRMLKLQYRMHADICAFPSEALYENDLAPHSSVESHLLIDLPNIKTDLDDEDKEDLGYPIIFFDTAGCEYFERTDADNEEGSRCNENEAMVVKNWVSTLTSSGVLASQIAVITPYQAQVTFLASLLRPTYGSELEIGTVDGMQGREKDAVIISLVRSNDKREVGFLKDKRRLNVAMTRAKRQLCIVGDSSTVRHGSSYLEKWMLWLEKHADVRFASLE